MFRLPWHSARRETERVFISYRRADTIVYAELIYRRLVEQFGAPNVFFDKEEIDLGDEFARIIEERVGSCDVLLAVIGPKWLTMVDGAGQRRLDKPNDYVRYEIAVALSRNIRVIPVLVGDARVPEQEQLPQKIAALATRNAHDVRDASLKQDIEHLIARLLKHKSFGDAFNELTRRIRLHRLTRVIVPVCALVMFFALWVQLFDSLTLDTKIASYTMWLGERFAPVNISPDIAIVAINEETERALNKRFDRSWRSDHARLLRNLSAAQAKVVVFDMEFKDASDFDPELIAAVKQAQGSGTAVVLGTARPNPETTEIERVASGIGLMCIGKRLSYATLSPLAAKHDGRTTGSLALYATHHRLKVRDLDVGKRQVVLDGPDNQLQYLQFPILETVETPQSGCAAIQQGHSVAQLMIKLSPVEKLRELRHRYEDLIVQERTDLDRFKGKIVLVALEKKGEDQFEVRGGEQRFGIELYADAVNNLMSGITVRPLGEIAQFFVMLGMSAGGAWLRLWRPSLAMKWRRVLLAIAIAVYFAVTVYAYKEFHVLLSPTYDLGAFALAYFLVGLLVRKWSA